MAVLIFFFAIVLRVWLRWPVMEFIGTRACTLLLTLCVIGHFSGLAGLEIFDTFNLPWLGTVSVFIAPPWTVGLLAGSLLLRFRCRASHQNAA